MWVGLLVASAWAMPTFNGTLAADGQFTLRVVPDASWESAELHVVGGGVTELGPAEPDVPVVVEGWTEADGPLRVTLISAQSDGKGITWMVEIDPFRVPASSPSLTARRSKKKAKH